MASNYENMQALQKAIAAHKPRKKMETEYVMRWVQNGQPREERHADPESAKTGYINLISFAARWPDKGIHSSSLHKVVFTEEDITPRMACLGGEYGLLEPMP